MNSLNFEKHAQALAVYKHLNEHQLRQLTPAVLPAMTSTEMTFTRETLRGVVMKRIEGFQFYHSKSEHDKTLLINLSEGQPMLRVYKPNVALTKIKKYFLIDIQGVTASDKKPVRD